MVKVTRLIAALAIAAALLVVPATAIACFEEFAIPAAPRDGDASVATAGSEADVTLRTGVHARGDAAGQQIPAIDQGSSGFLPVGPGDHAEVTLAMAALAPAIFALLSVGAYAVAHRRSGR